MSLIQIKIVIRTLDFYLPVIELQYYLFYGNKNSLERHMVD